MQAIDHLKNIPLFKNLRPQQLADLANIAKAMPLHAHQEIVRQGDLGKLFVIVDEGYVNLWHTDAEGVETSRGVAAPHPPPGSTATPKNYFGEQMFTSQEAYEFRALAVTDAQAFIIERGDFDALTLTHPDLLDALPFVRKAEQERTRGYEWIGEGEVVAAVMYKHWWLLVPGLARILLGALVLVLLKLAIDFFGLALLALPVTVAGILLLLAVLFYIIYDWRNDEYIVTNQRIAHVERVFVISRELRESVPIDRIQGVSISREGFGSLIGVGDLIIQSAGSAEGSVVFAAIANADDVRGLILGMRETARAQRMAEDREKQRSEIQSILRGYILPQSEETHPETPPAPPPRPTIWKRIRALVDSWLGLEIKQASATVWRKHWILLFQQTRNWFLGLVGLTLLFVFLAFNPGFQVLPSGGYILGGLVALLICLGGFWWEWEDWRNDTYAVTDTQIIDAERLPLNLREKSTTALLDQVQDVRIEVPGILANLLNYGDLRIETAGKSGQMIFHSIHAPREASEEVFRRLALYRKRRADRERQLRSHDIVDALIGYDRIRKEEERWRKQQAAGSSEAAPPAEEQAPNPPASDAEPTADESDAAAAT